MRIRKPVSEKRRRLHDRKCVLRLAVDELRAELDGKRQIGSVDRQDAAADSLATLEDADLLASSGEIACRGEACGAGTDDDDVESVSH